MNEPLNEAASIHLPYGHRTTELGPLPEEWEVVRLGDLATKTFGGGTPSTKKTEFWDGSIPWTTTAVIGAEDIYLQGNYPLDGSIEPW